MVSTQYQLTEETTVVHRVSTRYDVPVRGTPEERLHLVVERISSLFRAELRETASARGLKLVQLEALVYLAMANRYSDTSSAVAEYLAITKGTASQTLNALERRGLITRVPDAEDRRVVHCHLTDEGNAVADDAFPAPGLPSLAPDRQDAVEAAAVELLRALQAGRGFRSFGQCRTCALFERRGSRFWCGLTQERLSTPDSLRICREHTTESAGDPALRNE